MLPPSNLHPNASPPDALQLGPLNPLQQCAPPPSCSHLCPQGASSLALLRTAALVGAPLPLRVLTQHVLSLVHNVLQLVNEHLLLQGQDEVILHLRGGGKPN